MTTVLPINQRASAAATFVEDFPDDGPLPGQFHFYTRSDDVEKRRAGILFGCPCGCGSLFSVGFDTHESNRPRWNWNGATEGITLTPSINILQMDEQGVTIGEHWHGFLTDGQFRSC